MSEVREVLALESREGSRASRRVEEGLSMSFSTFSPFWKKKKKKKPKDLGHLQKRVCWETEATAQPRSQGEAAGGRRDRGEGQNLASEQKASFEAHGSRGLAQRSGPMVLSTLTLWQRQQSQQRLSVALQRPGPSCVSTPLCPMSGNPCVRIKRPQSWEEECVTKLHRELGSLAS